SQKPEVLDEWMTSQILIITATPNDDTDKQVKQKNLHRLFRHLRIGLFLVLPVIAIFLGWIIWQKSQSDKSDKQKASYYNFSVLLEKSQTYLNKNSNPVTYDNDFT
ncbi:MAG: caspase family protein, partial [Nostoc sp.]